MYNKHFVYLNHVGHHDAQKFLAQYLRTKKSDAKSLQIKVIAHIV